MHHPRSRVLPIFRTSEELLRNAQIVPPFNATVLRRSGMLSNRQVESFIADQTQGDCS